MNIRERRKHDEKRKSKAIIRYYKSIKRVETMKAEKPQKLWFGIFIFIVM